MIFYIRISVLFLVISLFNLNLRGQSLMVEPLLGLEDIQITTSTDVQKRIMMDQDPNTGKKVFVWQHYDQSGTGNKDIYCAVYSLDMTLLNQFRVHTSSTGDQMYPTVKVNTEDNSFVVAWSGFTNNTNTSDPNQYDIYAKKIRFSDVDTDRLNPDLLINSYVTKNQILPQLSFNYTNQEVIVAWIDQNGQDRLPTIVTGIDYGSYARRINYADAALSLIAGASDFRINHLATVNHQSVMGIEVSPVTGDLYTVCHEYNFPNGNDYDIIFRKFTRGVDGNYIGGTESIVNTTVSGSQHTPSIVVNSVTGDYVISWNASGSGIVGWNCYSRVFNKSNVEIKSDFKVAPFVTDNNELAPKPAWDISSGYIIYFHWYSVSGNTSIRYTVFDKTFTKIANDVFAINKNLNNYYAVTYSVKYDQYSKKIFLVYDQHNGSVSTGWFRQFRIMGLDPIIVSDQNYIETQTLYKEVKDETILINDPLASAYVSRSYLDGLGRSIQEVSIASSPLHKDQVQPIEYDAYGRQVKSYLPYTHSSNDGAYKSDYAVAQADFYNNNTGNNADRVINDLYPYSETKFESNVAHRISEQSAPGNSWKLGSGHTASKSQVLNAASDNIRYWSLSPSGASSTSYYLEAALLKNIVYEMSKDPGTVGGEMGKILETFTDKFGRVICEKVKVEGCTASQCILETYYVYDIFDNVKFIIPPQAIEEMSISGTWSVTYNGTTKADHMTSGYKYDKKQRVIEKKLPGKSLQTIIYNKMNKPVLIQDGNLKAANKWTFAKYDVLGRTIMSGVYVDSRTVTQIQNDINSKPQFEKFLFNTPTEYTNVAYPLASELNVLTIDYYDNNYSVPYEAAGFLPEPVPTLRNKGRLMRSKKRNLGNNVWLSSVFYYDKYGRQIQVRNNNHKQTTFSSSNSYQYDFSGLLLAKKDVINTSIDIITTNNRYEYDHAGRLKKNFQKTNGQAEVLLSAMVYNELGQSVEKNLHSDNSGGTFLQSVDYTYNIRGWLTHINNSTLTNSSVNGTPLDNNNDTNDLFGMEIGFDKSIPGMTAKYNGGISGIMWKTNNTSTSTTEKAYRYTYDGFGQLIDAEYGAKPSSVFQYSNAYRETNLSYDKNGNIKTLTRYGNGTTAIDNLTYNYNQTGNQLLKVTDATLVTAGFNDRVNQATEYTYDANGNLIADPNKGITSIIYNHLDLPIMVIFGPAEYNNRVEYVYDALGTMLTKKVIKSELVAITTDYVGSVYYENNVLQYIATPEGRAVRSGTQYSYQYILKDYLGNTRVLFDKNSTTGVASIIQENHYYAFGMKIIPAYGLSNDGGTHNFLYNGKEFQAGMDLDNNLVNEYDWDVYDFGARMYDPALGRWFNPDPADQFADYTPYGYCMNNPVSYVDPDGRWIGAVVGAVIGAYMGAVAANDGQMLPWKWDFKSDATYMGMAIGGTIGAVGGNAGENMILSAGVSTPYGSAGVKTSKGFQSFYMKGAGYGSSELSIEVNWGSGSSGVGNQNGGIGSGYGMSYNSDPQLEWGQFVDPNSFRLKKIGEAYYVNAYFEENFTYLTLSNRRMMADVRLSSINIMVPARNYDGTFKSKVQAQHELAGGFEYARSQVFWELKTGRIQSDAHANQRFVHHLNFYYPAREHPFSGYIPKSVVEFRWFVVR